MKKIVALAAAVLLSVGAQAATGHHAPKAKTVSAHAGAKSSAKAHKPTLAKAAGKKAQAHKHGAQKHAAKATRKAGHKHA